MPLSANQIAALAPDPKPLVTGELLLWDALGWSDLAIEGECRGSATSQVRVALDDPVAKCRCPSRKCPYKHSLAPFFSDADLSETTETKQAGTVLG